LAFGPDGNLDVGIRDDGRILRVRPDGASEVFLDGAGGLDQPTSLTFGPFGRLYTTSAANGSLYEFPPLVQGGSELTPPDGTLWCGVTFALDGTLLLGSVHPLGVERRSPARVSLGGFGTSEVTSCFGPPVIAPDGTMIVADPGIGYRHVYASDGSFIDTTVNDNFGVVGLCFGADGRLYGVSALNRQVARSGATITSGLTTVAHHPDLAAAQFVAFAPFRFKATIKGESVSLAGDLEKPSDRNAVVSLFPRSGAVMVAFDEADDVERLARRQPLRFELACLPWRGPSRHEGERAPGARDPDRWLARRRDRFTARPSRERQAGPQRLLRALQRERRPQRLRPGDR
jgi:hypothetical protein